MNQKGISSIVIILIIVAILVIAGGIWAWQSQKEKPVVCTQDTKLCPDGSYVSRTGPNCEFAACPEVKDETANWQTFNSIEDGNYKPGYLFTLRYPPTWYFETHRTKEGYADDQDTQFSDYELSRGEEGILLKPIPKENCAVFVTVDYTGRYMDTSKKPNFTFNNSYNDPAKKAKCDSVIQHIKESLSAEFTIQ